MITIWTHHLTSLNEGSYTPGRDLPGIPHFLACSNRLIRPSQLEQCQNTKPPCHRRKLNTRKSAFPEIDRLPGRNGLLSSHGHYYIPRNSKQSRLFQLRSNQGYSPFFLRIASDSDVPFGGFDDAQKPALFRFQNLILCP